MPIIIGEKVNTVNPRVRRAIAERDADFLRGLVAAQAAAGADVIDVNVSTGPHSEAANMRWAIEVIQDVVDLPLAIDSPSPDAVRAGLEGCRARGRAWANSVTMEDNRLDGLLPTVAECGCRLIGLCMDGDGVPKTPAARLVVGKRLVEEVERRGVPRDRLYLDALLEPVSVVPRAALVSVETIRALRAALPDVKTVMCLSAISFGLPARRLLNRAFLPLLLDAGVDAVFLDPLDDRLMAAWRAARVLLGRDGKGVDAIADHGVERSRAWAGAGGTS